MQKAIKINKLAKDQLVQVLEMGDYFDDGGPEISEPVTLQEFIEEQVDGEDISPKQMLEAWYEMSGDGTEDQVLLTIHDGKICVVLP
jgi:hypothetical protein